MVGFEPTTSGLWARRAAAALHRCDEGTETGSPSGGWWQARVPTPARWAYEALLSTSSPASMGRPTGIEPVLPGPQPGVLPLSLRPPRWRYRESDSVDTPCEGGPAPCLLSPWSTRRASNPHPSACEAAARPVVLLVDVVPARGLEPTSDPLKRRGPVQSGATGMLLSSAQGSNLARPCLSGTRLQPASSRWEIVSSSGLEGSNLPAPPTLSTAYKAEGICPEACRPRGRCRPCCFRRVVPALCR